MEAVVSLSPEIIINELNTQIKFNSNFPIEVFPCCIKDLIEQAYSCYNYPIDYLASSILFATSLAIGNKLKVITKDKEQAPVLYMALVGDPGANKTAPIKFALRYFDKLDKENYQAYLKAKKEYEAQDKNADTEKPYWLQYLITDATIEAIVKVHSINKTGVGLYSDELALWFNNFNRYNKGSDEQYWLSNWSGTPIRVNRKTTDSVYIDNPFISVIGGIQPNILFELTKNNRLNNGFIDRILFCYPDLSNHLNEWNCLTLDEGFKNGWDNTLSQIIGNIDNQYKVKLSDKANRLYKDWYNATSQKINDSDERIKGIYPKLQLYVPRLAIVLEVLYYFTFESKSFDVISEKAIQGAIQLANYFEFTAIKVRNFIFNIEPLESLPEIKKHLYRNLPDKFSTNEAIRCAKSLQIPERTLKYFLSDTRFFERLKRGYYEKK